MNNIIINPEEQYKVLTHIKDSVKYELGYPMVDVELPDKVIELSISRALTEMAKYGLLTLWQSVPLTLTSTSGVQSTTFRQIDTSGFLFKISYIVDILKSRGSNEVLTNTSDISGVPLGWAIRSGRDSMNNFTDTISNISMMYNERILVSRLAGTFKDNCSFDFDKARQVLHIDPGYPPSSNITIEYVPILTIDQIGILQNFPDALDFLTQYTVALSLIAIGRARGKFQVSNYDWSISSTELITSGQNKQEKLIEGIRNAYSHIITD